MPFYRSFSFCCVYYNVKWENGSNEGGGTVTQRISTIHDVRQLLKQFGTIIYTGDALGDLELMEEELRELFHKWQMISSDQFRQALGIIWREREKRR